MPALSPNAALLVGNDRAVFGWMQRPPETVTWNLPRHYGAAGARYAGFSLDPGGRFLIQSPQNVFLDADETQWTASSGTYGHGTGAQDRQGKKSLRSTGTGAFATTHNYARAANEGLFLVLFVGAGTAASPTFYVAFNSTLRLALEPGQPIRLQTYQSSDWKDALVAEALGECEAYLSGAGRYLTVDVLALTDPSWLSAFPASGVTSKAPPNEVVVSLNGGDAVLTLPASSFPAGSVAVSGQNRQWGCFYAKKRYNQSATATLPPQARPEAFASTPVGKLIGYIPASAAVTPTITTDGGNVASATIAVAGTADSTGFCVSTVALTLLDAAFPAVAVAPASSPGWAEYEPVYSECRREYDPATGTVRASAVCEFANNNGEFAPGSAVHQAVRAAQLLMGYDGDPLGLAAQITGYTALGGQQGQAWAWENRQNTFRVTIQDRGRKGDPDQTPCGYVPAFDSQPHYYAMRHLLNKEGCLDGWLGTSAHPFPLMGRDDSDSSVYYLPAGTNQDPALLFHPSMPLGRAREEIRRLSAAIGGDGTPYPMVMGYDPYGFFLYFPLPTGVVSGFLDQSQTLADLGLTPYAAYSATPGFDGSGDPLLNEILDGGLRTFSDLTNVRSPVVYEGLDLTTGSAVIGYAFNDAVSGAAADPDAPGYIGTSVPFFDISRYVNSQAYAQVLSQIAFRQLSFPSVGCDLLLWLQPRLGPLNVITVADYNTQGTTDPVPYYTTVVDSVVDRRGLKAEGLTRASARLLGQA